MNTIHDKLKTANTESRAAYIEYKLIFEVTEHVLSMLSRDKLQEILKKCNTTEEDFLEGRITINTIANIFAIIQEIPSITFAPMFPKLTLTVSAEVVHGCNGGCDLFMVFHLDSDTPNLDVVANINVKVGKNNGCLVKVNGNKINPECDRKPMTVTEKDIITCVDMEEHKWSGTKEDVLALAKTCSRWKRVDGGIKCKFFLHGNADY